MKKLILSLSFVVLAFMLASCGDDSGGGDLGVTAHLKIVSSLPAGTKITEFAEGRDNYSVLVFQYFVDHVGATVNNNAEYYINTRIYGGSEPNIRIIIYHYVNATGEQLWESTITVKDTDYLKSYNAMQDTLVDWFLSKPNQSYEGSISL